MSAPTTLWLKLTLDSDATFGRGDGVAGMVDAEVQQNVYGLPYLSGKTLKGLLCAECAEILYALKQSQVPMQSWRGDAQWLFGDRGSRDATGGKMFVGDAHLPDDLCAALISDFAPLQAIDNIEKRQHEWGKVRIRNLEALTALRRQTAMGETGAPLENTLRTMRVILRETPFVARLDFDPPLPPHVQWLLAACVQVFHRAGTGRNRGRGRLRAELYDSALYDAELKRLLSPQPVTAVWFDQFAKEVRDASAHVSTQAA